MRFLYAIIGVAGGVLSAAAVYLFFHVRDVHGRRRRRAVEVHPIRVAAFLLAALLNLVAGFLDPRTSAARRLLVASAVIWPLGAALIGGAKYFGADGVSLLSTVKFIALLSAPALLPLAAWAFACWKFV